MTYTNTLADFHFGISHISRHPCQTSPHLPLRRSFTIRFSLRPLTSHLTRSTTTTATQLSSPRQLELCFITESHHPLCLPTTNSFQDSTTSRPASSLSSRPRLPRFSLHPLTSHLIPSILVLHSLQLSPLDQL
jgi:hypothetical protein